MATWYATLGNGRRRSARWCRNNSGSEKWRKMRPRLVAERRLAGRSSRGGTPLRAGAAEGEAGAADGGAGAGAARGGGLAAAARRRRRLLWARRFGAECGCVTRTSFSGRGTFGAWWSRSSSEMALVRHRGARRLLCQVRGRGLGRSGGLVGCGRSRRLRRIAELERRPARGSAVGHRRRSGCGRRRRRSRVSKRQGAWVLRRRCPARRARVAMASR